MTGGAIPRRSSTATTRKPATTDDMHVNLVMKMGFSRKVVELAVRTLRKCFADRFLSILFSSLVKIHGVVCFPQVNKKWRRSLDALSSG